MRRLLIAGNWKMNKLRADGEVLIRGILDGARGLEEGRELLLFPPYTLLQTAQGRLAGTRVGLGGQDLHWEDAGAYTSAISGPMLRDLGCTHVLIGHSERREHFGDDSAILAKKLRAAQACGLAPVFCVGEKLAQREDGSTEAVLKRQFEEVLTGLSPEAMRGVTLAYEPVWAIGTGKTATPEIAQDAHRFLRSLVSGAFGDTTAETARILYGGSVKPDNATSLLGQPDVDGALVGGACLDPGNFLGIARG